jgi:hypothetical protein
MVMLAKLNSSNYPWGFEGVLLLTLEKGYEQIMSLGVFVTPSTHLS